MNCKARPPHADPADARGPDGRQNRLAAFPPEYFAMVMATGIVSLAIHDDGLGIAAKALLWFNTAIFILFWAMTFIRLIFFRAQLIYDATHHFHSAAFLTMVAAACILGCQFVLLTSWISVAKILWYSGIGLWVLLIYTFFSVVTVLDPVPPLEAGINGVWLLTVVSTESVAVLGALIAPLSGQSEVVLFVSLVFCLAGGAAYAFFITLILYRWMFFRMKPEKLTPDYWIDMGALAIVTLSLALLLSVSNRWTLLSELGPFLKGFMLLFWAAATWWIPFLSIVEIWRHSRGKVPFNYGPDYWALVFPLGMYSVATDAVIQTAGLTFLRPIAKAFSCVATLAWALVFFGLLRNLMRGFSSLIHGASKNPRHYPERPAE